MVSIVESRAVRTHWLTLPSESLMLVWGGRGRVGGGRERGVFQNSSNRSSSSSSSSSSSPSSSLAILTHVCGHSTNDIHKGVQPCGLKPSDVVQGRNASDHTGTILTSLLAFGSGQANEGLVNPAVIRDSDCSEIVTSFLQRFHQIPSGSKLLTYNDLGYSSSVAPRGLHTLHLLWRNQWTSSTLYRMLYPLGSLPFKNWKLIPTPRSYKMKSVRISPRGRRASKLHN